VLLWVLSDEAQPRCRHRQLHDRLGLRGPSPDDWTGWQATPATISPKLRIMDTRTCTIHGALSMEKESINNRTSPAITLSVPSSFFPGSAGVLQPPIYWGSFYFVSYSPIWPANLVSKSKPVCSQRRALAHRYSPRTDGMNIPLRFTSTATMGMVHCNHMSLGILLM
jgi:hypothetical protein